MHSLWKHFVSHKNFIFCRREVTHWLMHTHLPPFLFLKMVKDHSSSACCLVHDTIALDSSSKKLWCFSTSMFLSVTRNSNFWFHKLLLLRQELCLPAFLMSPVKNRQELPTVSHTASEQRVEFQKCGENDSWEMLITFFSHLWWVWSY